jgi:16S rRNA (uracil1498-N3)-methyltransferase
LRIDDSELLNQWGKVFRLKVGDKAIVFDGSGFEYEAEFELLTKKEAVLKIGEKKTVFESTKRLHIFQSIIKKDNFELIVQKCTEIGVAGFHPIISERSEKKDLNIERLQKIAKEASEQSGKGKLPEIFAPAELAKATENFDGELFVLDFEGEKLSSLLPSVIPAKAGIQEISEKSLDPLAGQAVSQRDDRKDIGILIGPEGGWTENEREFFKRKNIVSISLGEPVLRAETAAIAIAVKILL